LNPFPNQEGALKKARQASNKVRVGGRIKMWMREEDDGKKEKIGMGTEYSYQEKSPTKKTSEQKEGGDCRRAKNR